MSDRELLELAAKAAGLHDAEYQDLGEWGDVRAGMSEAMWSASLAEEQLSGYWNPLTDDGDALRLAVLCELSVYQWHMQYKRVAVARQHIIVDEPLADDPIAATRRAIVRAAAEIGRRM